MSNKVYDGIMGLVVGDAVGVPYEFKERYSFRCEGMTGFGTYSQPPGTWSDDSSLTLATLDSLIENSGKIKLDDMMIRFREWLYDRCYTARGQTFDVGNTTRLAIARYDVNKNNVYACGGKKVTDNGNGSLMRILPLAFMDNVCSKDIFEVSALTHAHSISQTACVIYVTYANKLLHGYGKDNALRETLTECEWCLTPDFVRLPKIKERFRDEISSSGYVVHSLEAALWCFLTTDNYRGCILKAVNLGNDTDTIAAIAGGLAGIFYGADSKNGIPEGWKSSTARMAWIVGLCEKFNEILNSSNSR